MMLAVCGAQAAVALLGLSHTSVRAPRAAQEATQLCLATRATVLRADWWRVERGTMAELHHVQTSVRVPVIGGTQAQR